MLKKFSVKNFKGFEKELVFDLANTNDYQFSKQCVNNGIVQNAIIYGKNGSGKSNVGFALFDIVMTLTDKSREMINEYINYKNLNNDISEDVSFKYEFKFDDDILIYEYRKKDLFTMSYEKIKFNGELILEYDFNNKDAKIINIEEARNLTWANEKNNQNISSVKYIFNNTILSTNHPISKLMSFVNGMLWFRSVCDNQYIEFKNGYETLSDIILKNDKLKDFENFLREKGVDYDLIPLHESTGNKIGIKFKNAIGNFETIISTGTMSLWLYYCWSLMFNEVKFVFIDEFDANYHFELSADIVKFLNEQDNLQTMVTTHNVSLMSNKLTRPDCVFIINNNRISNLSNLTEKELREAYNIEKLYTCGSDNMIFKLWLTWKNSKGKSFAIGELTYEEEKNEYIFKYINPELNSARENGFDFFPGFDDIEKEYVSNTGLFPNIETRLPNTSRPEYLEILNSFDLEINSSQMEILERTKGRLLTDNFEFVSAFDRSKNKIEFEVAGTAYSDDIKENKNIFEINDKLLLEREADNEYDEYAISVICTKNGKNYKLGYVPRYYSKELSKLLNENVKYSAQIKYLNFKSELNDEDITADVKLIIESK